VGIVLDDPSASLRERDDSFGRPTNRIAKYWRDVDHAVIGNDQASDEVWPNDSHLLGAVIWVWVGIHRLLLMEAGTIVPA
jgi:hypothetical protein